MGWFKSTAKKTTERIKSALKTTVIKAAPQERDPSKKLEEDPFTHAYEADGILKPPFDMLTLATMRENNTELGPAVDAMVVNIDRLGYQIVARPDVQKENEDLPAVVNQQIRECEDFFANSVLDEDTGTFDELKARIRHDLEMTGNAYVEVIPNAFDPNKPAGLEHLPSWTMRLRKQDDDLTNYNVKRAVQVSDDKWEIKEFPTSKRFRRFVQIRESGLQKVYFKEWNDPRRISCSTGLELAEGEGEEGDLAHEVIHFKIYSPRSPYGLPRWIGHLFAIYGSRAAEEINYVTFDNNQIPALALMATNVAVTQGSIDRMREFIEERVQGNKNYASILLIEGEPVGEGMRDPGSMKLEMKPLTEFQHADAMFKDYIQMMNDMVRRAFRLPPIFVGRADDYNRAVAEASRKLAEEQIFFPERLSSDTKWTNTLVARLGYAMVMFQSNTPSVTDNFALTQLLAVAERSGGLTPRISNAIVADVLGKRIPTPSQDINPDLPFSWSMLNENARLFNESADQSVEKAKYARTVAKMLQSDTVVDASRRILSQNNVEEILTSEQKEWFQALVDQADLAEAA